MGKRILVILGHPASNSFCGALAERYVQSALRAGHEVRHSCLNLWQRTQCPGRLGFSEKEAVDNCED